MTAALPSTAAARPAASRRWAMTRRLTATGVLLVVAATACTDTTGGPDATAPPSTPPTTGTGVDLAERPQIWFGPLDPTPPTDSRPFHGPHFFDLFEPDAPWRQAADSTHVLRLYGGWVARTATRAQLDRVVSGLDRRGIAIGFEAGPLPATAQCTGVVEGYAGPREVRPIVDKIAAAGGTIRFVGLQHGFSAGRYGPPECRKRPTEIAADLGAILELVRATFPDAGANLIETGDMDPDTIGRWLAAYREVLGEYPDSLHLDINYTHPDWPQRAREIGELVRSHGVEFGVFYRGESYDTTDRDWLARAWDRVVRYEVVHGGRPDHAVFQSWHPHPRRLLPDRDPAAFTHLINRYTAARSRISLATEPAGDGLTVSGRLTDAAGAPVADAEVQVRVVPQEGAGVRHEYVVDGVVPDGAVAADVGWRVNEECSCAGPADLLIERVAYREPDGSGGVPNGDFSRGDQGWGFWGSGSTRVVATDGGHGTRIAAAAGEVASANSTRFPVTAGSGFTASYLATVSPGSDGSGYFVLIFHDERGEIVRHRVALRPGWRTVRTVRTDSGGGFAAVLDATPGEGRAVQVWYGGGDTRWPARATDRG